MVKPIQILDRVIQPWGKPFVIAELSANHNGSLERAFQIMDEAKAAGAMPVKIQTYSAETITFDGAQEDFQISEGLGKGALSISCMTGHIRHGIGTKRFSSMPLRKAFFFLAHLLIARGGPLESLDCPAYKIASFEIIDHDLIEYAASTGKPMIMSTTWQTWMRSRGGRCRAWCWLQSISRFFTVSVVIPHRRRITI